MKLWEVLRLLEEDPTNVYEAQLNDRTVRMTVKTGFGRYYNFEVFKGKRLIDQSLVGGAFNGNVDLGLNWQLVRQPVTWQEALEAWAFKGKTIRCTLNGLDYIYKHEFTYGGDILLKSAGDPLELDEIKFGTWYIED